MKKSDFNIEITDMEPEKVEAFKKELLDQFAKYDKNKDFDVAEGPEKTEVVTIIETLITRLGDDTSNVFQNERGALLCYPWKLLNLNPPSKGEKWSVSFRAKTESFLLAYNTDGRLRGHLYSDSAEILETIRGFTDAQPIPASETPNLSFPVLLAENAENKDDPKKGKGKKKPEKGETRTPNPDAKDVSTYAGN